MIYLINPSEKGILENAGDRMPIGLLSIASQLNKDGKETKVYDLNHTDPIDFWMDYHSDKPETVGISVYTSPMVKPALDLAWGIKSNHNHKTKLIAGGIHATHMPDSIKEYFNLVIQGEGEFMGNIMNFTNGVHRMNAPDLTMTTDLNYDLLDMDKYGIDGKQGTLITSRGCFGNCSFCGKLERSVRYEPLEKVFNQMHNLKDKGFKSLYFLDDIFTSNKQRMSMITNYARKLNMPFRVTTRADLMDEDKMKILSNNGCDWLSIGIESGNNQILKKSNKGMTKQQNERAIMLASKYGIKTKGFFIIGLPGETEETAKQTIQFSKELREAGLNKADFYYLTPFPGTPIWDNPEKFDIEITDKDYTKYLEAGVTAKCYVNTKELKAERIEELVKEARAQWK